MTAAQALIVIDVQNGIFELPIPVYEQDRFIGNVRALLANARAANAPIFLIQHCGPAKGLFEKGTHGWQFHASLDQTATDIVIEKSHPGACHGSDLEKKLKDLNIKSVAVCGFATPYCVDTTIRGLYAADFEIKLASDAHSTTDGEILSAKQTIEHHNWIFTRFAKVTTADEIHFGGFK